MAPSNLEKAVADRDAVVVYLDMVAEQIKQHQTSPLDESEINNMFELVSQTQTELMDVNRRIIGCAPIDLDQHILAFKTLYVQSNKVLSKLRSIQTTTPSSSQSSSSCQAVPTEVRLPRLELPTFDGNLLQWVPFRDMFQTAVHNNASLSNAQKLTYLKGQLRGEANRLIQSLLITDANYLIAWDQLTARYQNDREILFAVLRKFDNMPNTNQNSHSSIRHIIDTTRESIRSLEVLQLPVEKWDAILLFFIVKKLDLPTKQLWEQSLKDSSIPPLTSLFEFLEQRARALAASALDSKGSKYQHSKEDRPRHSGHTTFHSASSGCPVCKKSYHPLFKCQAFANMNVPSRIEHIRSSKACFNCLSSSHGVSKCPSEKSCRQCGAKHHSMIHHESPAPEAPTTKQTSLTHYVQPSTKSKRKTIQNGQPIGDAFHPPQSFPLLSTARVRVLDSRGNFQSLRVLLDNGSNTNYVTASAVQALGLQTTKCFNPTVGLNSVPLCTTTSCVKMTLHPHFESNISYTTTVNVIPKITNKIPHSQFNLRGLDHLNIHPLADPTFHTPQEVDMLLGADFFYYILQPAKRCGPSNSPVAFASIFGWIVGGGSDAILGPTATSLFVDSNPSLDSLLTRFWEEEEVSKEKCVLSESEKQCETHFKQTCNVTTSGRFIVQLPIKSSPPALGLSLGGAVRRFKSMEKKLEQNQSHYEQYRKFMREYETLGHMQEIEPDGENPPFTYYIPHHFVLKKESTSTKFRVVFDASAKSTTGVSLNDTMLVGSTVQDSLINIVMRFRVHKIAFIADIQKMYRQILLDPNQTNLQRIVWRENPNEKMKHYKLLTVTYGTTSAPFLATAVLNQLAVARKSEFPIASEITLRDFYVDDLMSGASTVDAAVTSYNQLMSLCDSAHLPLRKWASNSSDFLSHVDQDLQETKQLSIDDDSSVKALGISWNPSKDVFQFKYSPSEATSTPQLTKRQILSEISKLFDPIGWLAPIVIKAKILMQQIHLASEKWDEVLPEDLSKQWNSICVDLKENLPKLEIPRHYLDGSNIADPVLSHPPVNQNEEFHLFGFSDASTRAYAAVVYLAAKNSTTPMKISLVTSKTRVAPAKQQSLPRLELCGALLLAELMDSVARALKIQLKSKRYWSDSTITLAWIRGSPTKWKTYVANRVSKIQQLSSPEQWHFIPGTDNPADCASRGVAVPELIHHLLWWSGPKSFTSDESHSEVTIPPYDEQVLMQETKQEKHICLLTVPEWGTKILNRFSSLIRLQRVTSYLLRFITRIRTKSSSFPTSLTAAELKNSHLLWIRVVQSSHFGPEFNAVKHANKLNPKSHLLNLNPFIDSNGLLRVGGRLRNSSLPHDAKNPILLPRKNHLTYLILKEAHVAALHAGPQQMLSITRQRFWILRAKDEIKSFMKSCVLCTKLKAQTMKHLMGDLPSFRVNPARPFLKCGVDYCGPFLIRPLQPRSKTTLKAYIAVFICFSVRAIHLEVVSNLTTSAFLAAFRRFMARRGVPTEIRSDCGTNFVGASKELRELAKLHNSESFQSRLEDSSSHKGIQWFFNPPASPHFGGLWEAGVKSMKYHLRRIMGNQRLTFEELTTMTTQIEAILNSRPLCPESSDPNDLHALTPAHFLIGSPITTPPDADHSHDRLSLLNRWQLIQKSTQDFWKRWSNEYLTRLQHRPKWMRNHENIEIGNMVIIKDENLPPLQWKLGRVVELHPGGDSIVRVVTVKTSLGNIKRPVVKLCLLPVNSDLC